MTILCTEAKYITENTVIVQPWGYFTIVEIFTDAGNEWGWWREKRLLDLSPSADVITR